MWKVILSLSYGNPLELTFDQEANVKALVHALAVQPNYYAVQYPEEEQTILINPRFVQFIQVFGPTFTLNATPEV